MQKESGGKTRAGIVMRRSTACPAHVVFNQVWDERFGYPGARSGRKGQNARFMIEVAAHRG